MDQEVIDLIAKLSETPTQIGELLVGLSSPQITFKSDDEFSILENVCHLRDIEVEGYSVRIRRILNEVDPRLADIDGSQLAVEREYQRQDITDALDKFTSARAGNVLVLKSTSAEDLQRTGKLEGVGQVTLERLLEMMREHDEGHVDDLRRSRPIVSLV